MAARGTRNMNGHTERIADPEEADALRRKGRRIIAQSMTIAASATAIFCFL